MKIICIDPPCTNTGNDFIYLEHFADRLERHLIITDSKAIETIMQHDSNVEERHLKP